MTRYFGTISLLGCIAACTPIDAEEAGQVSGIVMGLVDGVAREALCGAVGEGFPEYPGVGVLGRCTSPSTVLSGAELSGSEKQDFPDGSFRREFSGTFEGNEQASSYVLDFKTVREGTVLAGYGRSTWVHLKGTSEIDAVHPADDFYRIEQRVAGRIRLGRDLQGRGDVALEWVMQTYHDGSCVREEESLTGTIGEAELGLVDGVCLSFR